MITRGRTFAAAAALTLSLATPVLAQPGSGGPGWGPGMMMGPGMMGGWVMNGTPSMALGIDWPWKWVLAPFWAPFVLVVAILIRFGIGWLVYKAVTK